MTMPTNQARDPHADPLVASVARAAGTAAAPDCPDLEVLGLYADRELAHDERERVDTHLAACGRCQATVAALVRSAPEAVVSADVADNVRVPWWAGWRWMLPLASAAAVLAVTVWVGRGPSSQLATAPMVSIEAPASPPPAEASAPAAGNLTPPNIAQALEERSAQSFADGRMSQALPRGVGAAAAAKSGAAGADETKADRDRPVDAVAVGERETPLAKAEADAPAAVVAARPAPALVAPAAAAGARAETSAREDAPDRLRLRTADAAAVPDSFGWRVRDGAVERSTDDGKTWGRLTSPTAERLASISATDARTAVVTAEGGARFATSDGGASWRRLQ